MIFRTKEIPARPERANLQIAHAAATIRSFAVVEVSALSKQRSGRTTNAVKSTPASKDDAVSRQHQRPTLGAVIRALRRHHAWTLKEMSARTGIPFSTLSKVENNRLSLTYDKLVQLSERLNMRMSDLFAEAQPPDSGSSALARRSVDSIKTALRVQTVTYDLHYLCTELRKKRMVPVLTRIKARSVAEFDQLSTHSGEEWAYVLQGRVVVHTEFYNPVTLDVGQMIYLDSGMGHAYVLADGCDEALIIGSASSAREDHLDELLTAHA